MSIIDIICCFLGELYTASTKLNNLHFSAQPTLGTGRLHLLREVVVKDMRRHLKQAVAVGVLLLVAKLISIWQTWQIPHGCPL